MKWSLINWTLFLILIWCTLSKTQSESADTANNTEVKTKSSQKAGKQEKISVSQPVENITAINKTEDANAAQKSTGSQDSFLLEIQYLNEQIKLANQKIELIEQLRKYYLENNHTIPSISLDVLNDLSIESLHAPVIPLYQTSQPRYYEPMINDRAIQEQSRERQDYFMTRVIKKFSIDFNHTIKEMLYLPTKQTQRASDEAATSSLIVFLTSKNEIFLYNLNGHFLHSFIPQHFVKRFTVNTFQDDYFVATLGTDNTVRVENINVERRKIEPPPSEEKPSKKIYGSKFVMDYSSSLNITFDLETSRVLTTDEDFQGLVDREERDYGSINFILGKNIKFFGVGDDKGGLILFERGGKYKGSYKFPEGKFLSLQKHFPNPIFATDKVVGFFNPNMMEVVSPYCDPPGERVLKVELDQFATSNFYVLVESGDVLFYEIKQSGCKVVAKRSLHPSPTDDPRGFDIYSAKSFLFMLNNKEGNHIVAHNITDAQFADFQDIEYHNISLAQTKSDNDIVKSEYITQRSSFTSSSIGSYFQFKNGTSVFVQYEISIPPKPSNDWLSNFRLPIVFIAVLLAIGYQFWNRKKKKDDDEVMETLNKFKMQEAMGGKKGGMNFKDFDSLKTTIDSLSKQTNRMQEDLGNMSTKAFSQMAQAGRKAGRGFEDDIQEISTKKYI